ncbi:MAG: tRNA (adenosine(37)-N6)-threonylcarbamoyltransferase complex dimerization subunit type 1 TsaB [Hyphomicrobiales bacterium]|nr:tRNA (adenosine(37)-N6)-threonylcarbamoyltransferase complex dimerization subunit type 1 TsaB [Hyphomicrobiales bacterium]
MSQGAILALDTAPRRHFSLVVLHSSGKHQQRHFDITGNGHVESLAPGIEKLLADENVTFEDIERIAVNTGPGSFSGIRAGIATARGLSQATNTPLVGISQTELLAISASRHSKEEGVLLVVLDAGAHLFLQAFSQGETVKALAPPQNLPHDEALAYCRNFETPLLAGNGARLLEGFRTLEEFPAPDALLLATLAARREPADAPVIPIYIRPPDAKLPQK